MNSSDDEVLHGRSFVKWLGVGITIFAGLGAAYSSTQRELGEQKQKVEGLQETLAQLRDGQRDLRKDISRIQYDVTVIKAKIYELPKRIAEDQND